MENDLVKLLLLLEFRIMNVYSNNNNNNSIMYIPISILESDSDNDVMSFPFLTFTTRFLQISNSF